ncbi:MAG: hypothetical protein ABFC94_18560 [Syntrophomonas sp.]
MSLLLAMFSEDNEKAKNLYIEYMNKKNNDEFIDLKNEKPIMDEEEAKLLFEQISARQVDNTEVIRELKQKSDLSLRQIAAITGINKDRINKFLKDG